MVGLDHAPAVAARALRAGYSIPDELITIIIWADAPREGLDEHAVDPSIATCRVGTLPKRDGLAECRDVDGQPREGAAPPPSARERR